MAIDSKSLTIDSKKLLKAASTETPKQKVSAAAQLASLTPTQYAKLFPQHYNKTVEREAAASGKVASRGVSGGVPGTTGSNPGPVGGSGGARSAVAGGRTGRGGGAAEKPEPWHSQLRREFPSKSDAKSGSVDISAVGKSSVNEKGFVNRQEFYNEAVKKFTASPLNGFVPKDGEKYKIDGTPESWARFSMRVASQESSFNTTSVNPKDPGGSFGLFQFGNHYGINQKNWKDPSAQLDAFVDYSNRWVVGDSGYIQPPAGVKAKRYNGHGGFGAAFGSVRRSEEDQPRHHDVANQLHANAPKVPQDQTNRTVIPPLPEGLSDDVKKHYEGLKNDVERDRFREKIHDAIGSKRYDVEAINKMAETPPPIQSTSITPAPTDKTKSLIEQYPEGTERFFRSGGKTDGLNPKLVDVMREASKDLPPGYRVEMFSGKDGRKSGTTNHPGGVAIDLAIVDSNGKKLSPNGFGEGHKAYEQLAQSMRLRGQEKYPGTEYIWGGAWKSSAAGYGDRMHYQIKDPDQPVPGASRTSGQYSMDKGIPENYPEASSFMTPKELSEYKAKIAAKVLEERKFAREAPSASRQVASTQPAAPQAPLPMKDRSIVAGRVPPTKTAAPAPTATPQAPPPQVAPTTPKPTPQAGSMLSATQTQAPQVATPAPTNNDPGGSYDAPKEPPKDVPKMATGGEFQAGEPLVVADKRTGKIRAQINENETLNQKDKRVTVTPNHKTNPDDLVEKSEKKTERVEDDSDKKTKASNVTQPPPQASMRNGVSSSKPNWTDITQGSANPYHWNSFEKAMNRTGGRPPTYNDSTIKT